ncbi:uncharacterized protein LOC106643831, partial [Copidosoma floridanum]|uniref:uncharacterized protein LOC106643831 n=1 Tax=Copidosoma floridanum TaxID=29053 RepID=UPI0006C9B476
CESRVIKRKLLKNKPDEGKCNFLKAALLKRLAESKKVALKRLLTNLELGDSTPSQLWRRMKTSAKGADKALVKALWLSKLTCHAQTLLQAFKSSTTPMEELMEAADSLLNSTMHVSAVMPNDAIIRQLVENNTLMAQMLSTFKACMGVRQDKSNSGGAQQRSRSRSKSRQRGNSSAPNQNLCWYHNRFGNKASEIGDSLPERRLHMMDSRSRTRSLIDTGSVVSLVPKAHAKGKLVQQILTLSAANQTEINTYGSRQMVLNLDLRRDLPCIIIIADVPHAILGAEFLARYGLLPDLKNSCLIDQVTGLSARGHLAKVEVFSYAELLKEYQDVFEPGSTSIYVPDLPVSHTINTKGPSVWEHPRRLTGDKLAATKQAFAELLKRGIIRPSSSQWASPLHMVPKKDGSWRVTGDYRRLNACTISDRYPLPMIEDLLQESRGNVFSAIDLQKAFYQIPIAPEDVEKTAVTTPFGLYEFLGTSLSLRNATQSAQRTINHILRDLPFVKAYVDNLLIVSQSHEEHLRHLQKLLDTVLFLGYLVSGNGFQPPPAKVEAIKNFARPNTAWLQSTACLDPGSGTGLPALSKQHCGGGMHSLPASGCTVGPQSRRLRRRELPPPPAAICETRSSVGPIVDLTLNMVNPEDTADFGERICDSVFGRCLGTALAVTPYSVSGRESATSHIKHFERMLEERTFTIFTDYKPLIHAAQQRSDRASPRQARQLEFILRFSAKFQHTQGQDN